MEQVPFEFTDRMRTALQFVNSTARHIFLTGKAGTGKTTFLKNLTLKTHKQFAIVAPTGIAALNAGGTTIHSMFLLPFGMFIPDANYSDGNENFTGNWYTESTLARRHPLNSMRKQVLRSIDLLIIDEVSMLRADLLDAIDYRLRSVRNNFRQSFGGVQVLMIGDLYQLPPVVKREEESRLAQFYKSPWFFESHAIRRDGFVYIELDRIFRQSDNEFIRVLNNLRVNRPTREDLDFLNQYYRTEDEIKDLREVITLTTHNRKADELNLKALNELDTPSHFFEATIKDEFPDTMYPVKPRLELKVGAQIMFTRNDSEESVYYNGKLATVTDIEGDDITVQLAGGKEYTLRKSVWENKKYMVNPETKDLEDDIVGTFEQFPVKLAWAITVHKSQGLTFERAIIDVGQAFADGQVYVALSRLRSIDGLILRTKVDPSIVSTDKQIVSFDEENNRPETLGEEIERQQQEYLRRQFYKTFDFDPIINEIRGLTRTDRSEPSFDEKTMKPVLKQVYETLVNEVNNTSRFREQLASLLDTDRRDEFLERLRRGRQYYVQLLWNQVRIIAQHAEDMRHEKRVQTYVTSLGDLDQLFAKKLEDVDKVSNLAEGVLQGKIEFDFSGLRDQRAAMRAEILMSTVKSSGPKKKSKRKKKAGEPSTFDISIQMAEQGKTVAEIAKERGLVVSTIEGHLARGVESGRIKLSLIVPDEDAIIITEAAKSLPEGFSSSDLYSKFKGKYTYGQLRAVMGKMRVEN